jgi:HSP20 family protein
VKFSNQMPSLIDRFFNDDLFDWSLQNFSNTNSNLPAVNIKEKDDAFEIEMAAPGFNKEDFKIELNNNLLSISSEKKTENETKENERFTRREFSYQSFMRSFTLPNSIEGEKINAKYENGILNIHIPKKDEAKVKPVKQIEIK